MPKTPDNWKPDESQPIKDIVLESHTGQRWQVSMTVQDGFGVIDYSNFRDVILGEAEDEVGEGMIDALESLILGHACAGVDVEKDNYIAGIDDAVEAIGNHD